MAGKKKSAYAAAGVDIDEQTAGLKAIKRMIKSTAVKGLVSSAGSFGGMFKSPGAGKILVASTDGVGTKLKVAVMAERHDTVGQDLVNHCVNDILVQGAEPLFFLDYFGTSRLESTMLQQVVKGLCKACRENSCTLLGGETAEMPGLYPPAEYDLVGTIVGVVDRKKLITGKSIRAGDIIIGLASTGLHTNGYSLARRIVFEKAGLSVNDTFPGTRRSVASVLLSVHRSYLKPVLKLRSRVPVRGLAHITGGGFVDNIPRILPENTCAVIRRSAWKPSAVFRFLQDEGGIDRDEMYRVFNMGIGMVVVVPGAHASRAVKILKQSRSCPVIMGGIEKGRRCVQYAD